MKGNLMTTHCRVVHVSGCDGECCERPQTHDQADLLSALGKWRAAYASNDPAIAANAGAELAFTIEQLLRMEAAMRRDHVSDILNRIDAVEADLRSCETRLTLVRDAILRANGMGRLVTMTDTSVNDTIKPRSNG